VQIWNSLRWAAVGAGLTLFMLSTPAAADPCDNGLHVGNPHCAPPVSATPELDSLMLFGGGLLAVGGYAITRLRGRRRD